jgi:DNA polymerase-3 subunit delta'
LPLPEYPEPDVLFDHLLPRQRVDLLGHRACEREFLNVFSEEHMHHAWLLQGAHGLGKATMAWRMARFLLSQKEEQGEAQLLSDAPSLTMAADHPVFRQVAALSHPDLIVLQRSFQKEKKTFAKNIPVAELKKKLQALHNRPAGKWRVVLIDSADDMAKEGANAILKTLEEPPAHTVFLLISHHPGRLLPTILSLPDLFR